MNKPIRGNPTDNHNFPKHALNSNNGLYNEWVEGQYYNGFYCGGDYFIGEEKNLSLENDGLCCDDSYENAHRNTAVRKSQSTAGGGGSSGGEGKVNVDEGKNNHGYTNETKGDNHTATNGGGSSGGEGKVSGGIGTAPCDSLSPPVKSSNLHGTNRPNPHSGKGDKPTPKEAPKPIKEFDENYKSDEYRQPKDGNGYTEDAYTVAQKFIDRTQFPLG